jgi:aspartyl-tRNA(Asn)/glutamyl-tRNA(Gln) amidotransferase subunit B
VPVAPTDERVEELRSTLPEPPAEQRRRLQADWGFTDLEMRDVVNSAALQPILDTVAAGASPAAARKWWSGELGRRAAASGVELADVGVTPVQIAELAGLVEAGKINDSLARQVLDGVLAGEGDPAAVVEARGLGVVSDDGALLTAVDAAIAANPDVAQKVREGKVQAAGALIGAVMKDLRGQADAARVRELVIERLS